ncbi:MAG: glycosyltransferase, partial [Chloroflexia bacterium]
QESTTVPVESILTRMEDPVAAILSEAESDDIVIMGMAPQTTPKKSPDAESLALRVSQMKGSPLLLLNAPSELDRGAYSKRLQSQRRSSKSRTDSKQWVDMPFEHWFVEHTYHGDEFRDPEEFLRAKQASGLTLSVVVLTSNDAGKIHSVIMGLRKVLHEIHPIAEQILVVDAGSTDGTPQIARELGAEVYSASEILTEQGDLHGRGESWWKSLAVAKGDIIVWVDPRARRFHPSTVLALAGPLLRMPTLQLIKAYEGTRDESRKPKGEEHQRRGIDEFSPVDISWGGFVVPRRGEEETHTQLRVQALRPSDLETLDAGQLAMLPPRTLFQVLCPSLAGVSAPFGKDMAARRDTMMNLPVYAGDGFEIGLLLSVATEYGTNTIAQVELGQGQPASPPQPGLRGAVDLLQVMSGSLPDAGMRHYTEQITERLRREIEGKRTPSPEENDKMFEVRVLGPVERQPMIHVLGD